MSRKRHPSPEDRDLFRQTVGPVKAVHHDRVLHTAPKPKPRPLSRLSDEQTVLVDMMSDALEEHEIETGDELLYCRPGLQTSVLRKLRRGQYHVEAELDLHGLTVKRARDELNQFIHSVQAEHLLCVRIIHGKGLGSHHRNPILKGKVNHWLRQRDDVLAFCSARPVDGGAGAAYVLLRKRL